jgi:hypothetical protein
MIVETCVPSPNKHFQQMQSRAIAFDLTLTNCKHDYEAHSVVVCAISKTLFDQVSSLPSDKPKRLIFNYTDHYGVFQQVIDFAYGTDFTISRSNADCIYAISTVLQIPELADAATSFIRTTFELDSVIGSLLCARREKASIEPHLEYVREHFAEMLDREDLMALDPEVLDAIPLSDEIAIDNEDQLALWVSRVIQRRGAECRNLVDRLHLESLASDSILELCRSQAVDAPSLLELHRSRRSEPHAAFPKRHFKVADRDFEKLLAEHNEMTIESSDSRSFRGIIHAIKETASRGFPGIRVTASSVAGKYFHEYNLLDQEDKHRCWYSEGKPNQWVMFDFSPRLLRPSRYALRTSGAERNKGHLRSWVLLGSNDKRTWVEIDRQVDRSELNGGYRECSFPVKCDAFFRLYKFVQTEMNHRKDHAMMLSTVEFFGQIVPRLDLKS